MHNLKDSRLYLLAIGLACAFVIISFVQWYDAKAVRTEAESQVWKGYEVMNKSLNGKELELLIADTPEKRQKGLMNISKLDDYDGMIFLFNEASVQTFWNMNTLLDLDVYWLKGDVVVGKSYLPSITKSGKVITVTSPRPADTVIELPAGK